MKKAALTYSDKAKLGNAIVYIAEKVEDLSKTKLLKLLFFMEEYSVCRFQTPFLGMQYEIWQAGPVIKDVFVDLSETPVLLEGYVEKVNKEGNTYIRSIKNFSDEEFSDNDMLVMDEIISKYGNKTATELVKLTHKEGSLWYNTAKRNGLLEAFEQKKLITPIV
ncbi:MAG: SocA family protein [Bacteroidales bacterium]|nr:SocA family protein [Bacteroidales bacterium]